MLPGVWAVIARANSSGVTGPGPRSAGAGQRIGDGRGEEAMAPDGEHGHRRGSHAGDARSLPERARPDGAEPLTDLRGEPGHGVIVERGRYQALLHPLEARHLVEHPPDVAVVLRGDLDLAGDTGIVDRSPVQPREVRVRRLGTAEELEERQTVPASR